MLYILFMEMNFTAVTDPAQRMWDSESRFSPFSTVANPYEADFCEECEQDVDYSDGSKHGKCGCDSH